MLPRQVTASRASKECFRGGGYKNGNDDSGSYMYSNPWTSYSKYCRHALSCLLKILPHINDSTKLNMKSIADT